MTRNARGFMWFLQQRANKTGQSWWGQAKMAKELGVHRSTIIRWVAELVKAGELDSIRRGSTSNLYTLRKTKQLKLQNATTDVAKCNNATLELNLEQGNLQHHRPDDAALSSEVELKTLAGLPGKRITAGDRAFLAGLDAPREVIRAGILLGVARKTVQRARTGIPDPIRSLRYFESTIREAASLSPSYIQHLEQFVRRNRAS